MNTGLHVDMGDIMIGKGIAFILFLFMLLNGAVFAEDEGLRTVLDYKINKMKTELNLTDNQTDAIRPIIKDYIVKRGEVFHVSSGQGIVDHVSIKSTLKGLKDIEYEKLSKVLSTDQMQKLKDKDNLMAALNPDSAESTVNDETALTPEGADFKF